MQVRLLAVCLALASCVAPASAFAAGPGSLANDFRITTWSSGDGVTLEHVRAIVQDEHGYLWIASAAGLVRFDGFRFSRTDLVAGDIQLPAVATRTVYRTRDGSLWVGYSEGRGIYRIADGRVQSIHLEHEIAGFVSAIREGHDGTIWVGHDQGLHRSNNGRWERVPLPPMSDGRVFDVHEDRTRTLWVATASGLYRRQPAGHFEQVPHADGIVRSISEDPEGGVWITDEAGAFRRAGDPNRNHLFEGRGITVYHDPRGDLWVATIGQGLWTVQNAGDPKRRPIVRRASVQTGLLSDETSAFLEDRDGNIWVGAAQGLHRLSPYRLRGLVDLGVVQAVTVAPDNTAWVGTVGGLLAIAGTSSEAKRLVSDLPVRLLHTSAKGTVWAATNDRLYRVEGGALAPVQYSGPRLRRILAIASDRRGALWVCDEDSGLLRLEGGQLTSVVADAGSTARPVLLHVDAADRLWVGFEGGRVTAIDRDGVRREYGTAEGLPHATISAIYQDRRGNLWVGGDAGLSVLQGDRFRTLSSVNRLPDAPIRAVLDDDAGDLWLGTGLAGIVRVPRAELDRAIEDPSHRLRYAMYEGSAAGSSGPFNRSNAAIAPDGTLWFVSFRGLTVVDPWKLRGSSPPVAKPLIEGASVDERRYAAVAGASLPPRPSRLRIDYTVVNLSPGKMRFRYRLDGFDKDWVDGTMPRQAIYTNLPPGAYQFRVQATTSGDTWADVEGRWAFAIEPMFYETHWFYAVCALGIVLCAMGMWQLRMRQVRRELALVYGERMRVSREIHDTLMQNLYGIALQLDVIVPLMRESFSPVRAHVQHIRRQIEEHIAETRESILALRSAPHDKRDLVEALREAGERLTTGKVPLVFTVTGTPRPCPSKVANHALRIGREAILNAVRHSNARRVNVEVGFEERRLRVRVADDGRGFDAERERGGRALHYGLTTMRERAADAGGCCTIASVPGSGVEVVAEFPLAPTG